MGTRSEDGYRRVGGQRMHLGVAAASMARDRRGTGRYTRQVLRHLATLRPGLRVTLYADSAATRAALIEELPGLGYPEARGAAAPVRALDRDPPDVTWYPWGRITFVPPTGRTVVTIHDLDAFHSQYRSWFRYLTRWRTRHRLRVTAARADQILTDSQYSRSDILARLVVPPAKVTVVPLAADDFRPATGVPDRDALVTRFGITAPFFLYVGAGDRRKNLSGLLEAFRDLRARGGSPVQLVLCGSAAPVRAADPAVLWAGRVTDAELQCLYQAATAFVLPSFLEGFGLTVLEAMASGTPVLCSNATSLPEVAGDAALYFDPLDLAGLTDQMARCLGDPSLRVALAERGLAQARKFRWAETAQRTLDLFDALHASGP
jgi:alpha-1,3-rhamnosyl/mannosyltransferase